MVLENDFLQSCLIFLISAVIAVPLMHRIGLGSIVGYLLAGIIIGPYGFGLIDDVKAILNFSEFGVVLLLFLIGLELNPTKLWQIKGSILGFGGTQVIFTTVLISIIVYCIGVNLNTSLVIGMGLTLSSTAMVLRVLEEQKLIDKEEGRAGLAVLLFQDIAVIPMLALLPVLAGNITWNWLDALWKLSAIPALLVSGHYILKPLFKYVAINDISELFTIASLLLVIGISVVMEMLGLSMVFGAFLAGLLLADSEYRYELEVAIEPFKGLLLGLFFISIGMIINLGLLILEPIKIITAVLALVLIKSCILYLLAQLFVKSNKLRRTISVILSQSGEFAFVIFASAQKQGLLKEEFSSFLLLVVSLSMVTTPILLLVQMKWFSSIFSDKNKSKDLILDVVNNTAPQVIIVGFSRFGQILAQMMRVKQIKMTVLENDVNQINFLRRYGYNALYGDATQLKSLYAAGADKATIIIICTDISNKIVKIIALCNRYFPKLKILARSRSYLEEHQLLVHGIKNYSSEVVFGATDLGRQVLIALGMRSCQAKQAEEDFRKINSIVLEKLFSQYNENQLNGLEEQELSKKLEELFSFKIKNFC
ncbi:glutathione-regulated potassium-efflux system protein [Candidatus Photodesmus katoptron]|uniref:Glutathione-regulated potassium-efflux system protein KefB n=1 Tax=Candidatus Photodesmus katoptron Akat1 TaxID=1236703 RepID=S3DZ54_9GAMM|nr:monovalent cation:proton antiporter-2 (CPA2) family protein [Candidatus Photodesmus katoptron]EPE37206.1 glutathione-regulated potassium-efflux system protein KefB [Candidatus Photodesmus katoptron Akat1]KEY90139.1 glutathione-regulated potassium-efflux system protein [Candidatus Photodesmus katoptron]